jgi:hypothetical protein
LAVFTSFNILANNFLPLNVALGFKERTVVKLKALEKNLLKFRSFQMILLIHEVESLREFIIGSIRCTDKLYKAMDERPEELPEGTKKIFQKALNLLVSKDIITEHECEDIQSIVNTRNEIGHRVHNLVNDITCPDSRFFPKAEYDYGALDRIERYRKKIEKGLGETHIILLSFRGLAFDSAEVVYKEELSRLKKKIDRQHQERFGKKA